MTEPIATGRVIQTTYHRDKPTQPRVKRIWDNYKVIGEVQKSDRIKFVVAAGIRDGVKYINIREFYLRQKDSEWMPGKDGITIPLLVPIEKGTKLITPYKEMSALFERVSTELDSMPLYDEANAVTYIPKLKEEQK